MNDIRAQIEADQERHDSKVRNQFPRHRATVMPHHRYLLVEDDPWGVLEPVELLGWQAWCACRPSEVTNFGPELESVARAWRCPRSRRRT